MKLLVTGFIPPSMSVIAARLVRDRHQVVVLGMMQDAHDSEMPGVTIHNMPPWHPKTLRIIESTHFDAILFFYAYQCEDLREYREHTSVYGRMLDALSSVQHAGHQMGVHTMILVTDRRVFGSFQACQEEEVPAPDTAVGLLISAAENCFSIKEEYFSRKVILRVTSLYAENTMGNFFSGVSEHRRDDRTLLLHGDEETPCDFLHSDDFAMLLCEVLSGEQAGVIHLNYGAGHTYGDIVPLIRREMPELRIEYKESARRISTLQRGGSRTLDWVVRHDCTKEIAALLTVQRSPKRQTSLTHFKKSLRKFIQVILPWVDVLLFGAACWYLVKATEDNAALHLIDYWLIYVVLMGNIHGITPGIVAAIIACIAFCVNWEMSGQQLYSLIYNVDNWIPMISYVLCGSLFGYVSDRYRERVAFLENEKRDSDAEKEFLQTLYQQTYNDCSQLQEQVMRYRDSYGRIYGITRKLESMQPEQVFLSTIDVMEDIMQNRSVAIYSRNMYTPYSWLIVHSRNMKQIPRSINLENLDELRECIDNGRFFANVNLQADYPAMAVPIRDGNTTIAMVMLWDVPFEQQTLYYQNLLIVVSGLVQAALSSAMRFTSLATDMYITDTHILSERAFKSVLSVYTEIRRKKSGNHLLVRLNCDEELTDTEYDKRLAHVTRSSDLVGKLSDGHYYVLFPQAGVENLQVISSRMARSGLICELVEQEDAYA